ncbi:hypothetical protein amrb99_33640 [Actinomadura sp. RB99]|nr:hypothetical protein [Actinomadura sp. RB99]
MLGGRDVRRGRRLPALGAAGRGGPRPRAVGHLGEQRARHEHDGAHAAVGGPRVDRHREPVPGGEHPRDGEPDARRVAEPVHVHRRLAGQQLGGALELLGVHRDARVVDGDGDAVVRRAEVDLDGGVRAGVAGGVVEQLGERQHDRLDRPAGDRDVHRSLQVDPQVVADPGGRAAHHVGHRGRRALLARPRPAQHGGGLRAPAELGVHVVDAEQAVEHVGVVVPLLHRGDGELLLVGEALHGAHHRAEGRLGGLVGPRPDPVGGPGEQVHHRLQGLAEGGRLAGEVVQGAGDAHARVVERVHQLGQPDIGEVPQLLVAQFDAGREGGVLVAELGGQPPLARQLDGGGDAGGGHDDERRRQQGLLHRILVTQGVGRDEPASDRLVAGGTGADGAGRGGDAPRFRDRRPGRGGRACARAQRTCREAHATITGSPIRVTFRRVRLIWRR